MTGVDKLHDQGLTGTGILVGIVDTGVDYNHPALGGCFGVGCKISGGADLVGDAFNGTNTPIPDDDPRDCAGHGTHVSGILAADTISSPFPFVGVAPGVTINMYRVFGCNGSSTSDIFIDGTTRAFADGAQIISLSLGAINGWSESPFTVVANRLGERGVFLSVAAGNDGANGPFVASSPAAASNVAAVTSVDSGLLLAFVALTAQNRSIVLLTLVCLIVQAYFSGLPFPPGSLKLFVTAKSDDYLIADACSPLPVNTPDLRNYLVLTRRGTCTALSKVTNLAAAGARFILYVNSSRPLTLTV